MGKMYSMALQEINSNSGFTHRAVFTPNDITMATANTEQVFTLMTTQSQDQIAGVAVLLDVPFQDTADAAYNTTTIRVGDSDTDNKFVTATEMNLNGTEVYYAYNTGASVPTAYGATAKTIVVTFGAQSGKSLTSLKLGRVIILIKLIRPGNLELKATSA